MSKSLNNFVTIDDFLKTHTADTLRWLVLSHHYRSPIDFNDEVVRSAEKSLDTLNGFIEKLAFTIKRSKNITKSTSEVKLRIDAAQAEFMSALLNDFNTPEAIAALFTFTTTLNAMLLSMSPHDAKTVQKALLSALKLLGISTKIPSIPAKITKLVKERELSRVHKQFAQSDALRKTITDLGYSIDDTPLGPFVRRVWQ
jgi:cysteinyl-tRNA synthetase